MDPHPPGDKNRKKQEHTNTQGIGKFPAIYISQYRGILPCITKLEQSTTLLTHTSLSPYARDSHTQGHSNPQQRSIVKEKDGEQASARLQNFIPAEHTPTIVLFFLYLFLVCVVLYDSCFCFC
jgi:hypothetical protein